MIKFEFTNLYRYMKSFSFHFALAELCNVKLLLCYVMSFLLTWCVFSGWFELPKQKVKIYDLFSLEITFLQEKKNVIFLNRVSIKLLLWGFYLLVSRLTNGHIIKKDNTLPLWPIVFDYCMTLWNYAKTFFSYSFATRSYISIWIHKGWGTLLTYYSDFILDVLCSPV